MKINNWGELTQLTQNQPFTVERVKINATGIAIEGQFEPSPLSKLTYEDQVFVSVFVKTHGSIKEMERTFGVSYPTIKSRLNSIGEKLGNLGVEVKKEAPIDRKEILQMIDRGEVTVDEAMKLLKGEA